MGANEFFTMSCGATAAEAFGDAIDTARYEHGHGGYTGTIAEKREFKLLSVPADKDPRGYAEELMERNDKRVCDKWGPAGCVLLRELGDGEYEFLFFGLASS